MTKKIPFKISARTARLIGRQNFPNAEGAIIELVKNSYDADASICLIFFDNKFAMPPQSLTQAEYTEFSRQERLISKYYQIDIELDNYIFVDPKIHINGEQEIIKEEKKNLHKYFSSKCKLFIIDNGEGMTDHIIENFWMTIGTNNKEVDIFTNTGRVKTGAKGIGRFALDKLGDLAMMLTKPNLEVHTEIDTDKAFSWAVDWRIFEGDEKTLNQVEASLRETDYLDFAQQVKQILPSQVQNCLKSELDNFITGTQIEIGDLRDSWDDRVIEKLFTNLEVLIPPREERIFNIFLFSTLDLTKYGQVSPSVCDDYDYKVEAKVDEDGQAIIIIYRNEFDVIKFPDELFERKRMQAENFTKRDFERGHIVINKSVTELVPGLKEVDDADILDNIGAFEFIFYFIKNRTSQEDREKFLFKAFNGAARQKWLSQFGGIRLFRDNFRVRPYGETNSRAFDWLLLGERAGRSPQTLGQQRHGYWRVRPNQISGIINISRLANIDFEDTSSRYGLQENQTFEYFTQIIKAILQAFERDRSKIGQELSAYYSETQLAVNEQTAETVKIEIKNVLKGKIAKDPVIFPAYAEKLEADLETLAKYTDQLEEKIETMKNESDLLRVLASNALVIASFTHELNNIKNKLVARFNRLKETLEPVIDSTKIQQVPNFRNPFIILEDLKKEDEKLKQWLHYSLETLRKDKRRRTKSDLLKYFREYKELWQMVCNPRGVRLDLIFPQHKELKIRIFEADLDSIFNNLLINSLEAFLRKDAPPERIITIEVQPIGSDLVFIYRDSGPGLSKDIVDPESIFEPFETTKRDPHSGEEIGTGLGMWLVKSLVIENNGTIHLLKNSSGFGVSIKFLDKLR